MMTISNRFRWLMFPLALILSFNFSLFASCSVDNNRSFIVNELNSFSNWLELYVNPNNIKTPVNNWSVTVCTPAGCETKNFNFNINTDGNYIILNGYTNQWHKTSLDVLVKDDLNNTVDYFNLAYTRSGSTRLTTQEAVANACGLNIACNNFSHTNNGERDFARIPDGECTLQDSAHTKDTQDATNSGSTPTTPAKNGLFNAIDLIAAGCNATTHWNNAIKTKVVNDTIDLSILARDAATNLPLEATITKITLLHYPSGNNSVCSGTSTAQSVICNNCGTTNANGCLSYNIAAASNTLASKCVEVLIEGKDAGSATATLSENNATDNFAIRPDTYTCDGVPASPLIAEHPYASNVVATPLNLTTPTSGYTTSTVALSANKYMPSGDLNGSLNGITTPSTISFTDGSTSIFDLSFNDVGNIGIDINDATWAAVDSDDSTTLERYIHAECNVTFRSDHFDINLTRPFLENNATDFTYLANLSNDINMSAWVRDLNVTITAQGESNSTMLNYSDGLYANNITLSPLLSLPTKHSTATKRVDPVDQNSSDIAGFTFVNGIAHYAYTDVAFNYDRNFSNPIIPFYVDGNESFFSLNVQDTNYTSVTGEYNTSSDGNATFYFGRLRGNDIETTLSPVSNPIYYEVYDNVGTAYTQGMNQSSIAWYINNMHNIDKPGNIIEATASRNTLIDNALSGFTFTYPSISAGIEPLGIASTTTQQATIHLKTQRWLWYAPDGFGSDYNDTAGSDCTMHPCFQYTFTTSNTPAIIQSGDFNGTIVPDHNRSEYKRKGVKLFR